MHSLKEGRILCLCCIYCVLLVLKWLLYQNIFSSSMDWFEHCSKQVTAPNPFGLLGWPIRGGTNVCIKIGFVATYCKHGDAESGVDE